jgi:hypothetical protein
MAGVVGWVAGRVEAAVGFVAGVGFDCAVAGRSAEMARLAAASSRIGMRLCI